MIYEPYYENSETISLSDDQIDTAARHGQAMRKTSLRLGHRNNVGYHPSDEQAMKNQMLAAIAEFAIIVALPLDDLLRSETYQLPDLRGNLQVRMIGADHYGLRIYDKDIKPSDGSAPRRVVGVIIPRGGERKPYRLPGWYDAGDDTKREWWMAPNDRPPMCCVPQKALRPLYELRAILFAEGVMYVP